ncbi:MAG TPA: DUF1559 domain-containing protein [Thermoguttaceae bacterium]|nr:DUF1559 domain-containing protein [Thermoguttaceae bacterium]
MALFATLVSAAMGQKEEARPACDPAACAATIGPYLDDQAFLVARLDATRLDPMKLIDKAIEIVPELEEKRLEMSGGLGAAHAMVLQTGVREVYAVLSIADISFQKEPLPYLIVPLEGVKEESLTLLMNFLKLEATERLDDVFFAGSKETLERLKSLDPTERPELVDAFEAAGDTTAQVLLLPPKYTARLVEEMMPELPEPIGGGPSTVVTHGLRWAALGVDAPPNLSARLVVQSDDAQSATALREVCIKGLEQFGQIPDVREVLDDFGPLAELFTPAVEEDQLVLALSEERGDVKLLVDAMRAPLEELRGEARRTQSMNNLKQLALAMFNHDSAHRAFPTSAIYDQQGKPLLSWRVKVLPFIGQKELYEQFHLDEPWDSEHNRRLIQKMPMAYRGPSSKPAEPGRTPYVVPTGKGTAFPGIEPMTFKLFTDGPAQTLLIMEVDDEHAVVWTKPDDFPIDLDKPGEGLAGPYKGGIVAAFADGHIEFLSLPMEDDRLRALFTPAAGDKASAR